LNEGDEIEVKVLELDNRGRIKLSRKELLPEPDQAPAESEQDS
jgi:polyribonucleotide nucleotidyltransferase